MFNGVGTVPMAQERAGSVTFEAQGCQESGTELG